MTTSVLNEKNQYLTQFEQLERELGDRDPPWLRRLRKSAIARFAELGFPTARNEDWKFTNVAPVIRAQFEPAPCPQEEPDLGGETPTPRAIVLPTLNGFDSPISRGDRWYGIAAEPLSEAAKAVPEKVEPFLGRVARMEHSFSALNMALFRGGWFIYVPDNTVVKLPVMLVHGVAVAGEPAHVHPRNLIVVGKNAQVSIEEEYRGPGEDYFTNVVTEFVLGEGSIVDHYKVQRESPNAFHIATTAVHQAKGSNFRTHYIGLGGKLVRNEVHVRFDGEGCEATVNGLYLASGTQHMDNFTVIDHAKPHCASHELYKGILDGKARGVFNGKIFVRPDAQKTDAKQTNQTLLLSEDAVINTKPQLEIFADDVKCTHGATVGQLDPNQLFYLRARGLGLEEARNLLTFAFANDIIGRIQVEPLRKQLEDLLLTRQQLGKE